MPYFIGGIALLVLLLVAGRAFVKADPTTIIRFLKWLGIGLAVAVALVLIESGRFFPAVFLLGFGALLARRAKSIWQRWGGGASPARGQVSEVETTYLRMSLEHDTGTMTGTVRKGPFQGRRLEELDLQGLIALWREVRAEDPPSVSLLEGYLDRFMPDWRTAAAASDAGGGEAPHVAGGGAMTPDEAYAVLGLRAGASQAEIREAHRKLMTKLHPDMGGSDALAAQVNRARDVLLGD
jgi:hypothetical protein